MRTGVRRLSDNDILEFARAAVDTESLILRSQIVSVFDTKRFSWPLDPEYLLKWCNEGSEQLEKACKTAMTEIKADCIRKYAIEGLQKGFDADCLEMLIRNYVPDNEDLIISMLDSIPIAAICPIYQQ